LLRLYVYLITTQSACNSSNKGVNLSLFDLVMLLVVRREISRLYTRVIGLNTNFM
jgi:hypothetical protein